MRSVYACWMICLLVGACASPPSPPTTLLSEVVGRAIHDSGFDVGDEVFIREGLYDDVMALEAEGNPPLVSEEDRAAIEALFADDTAVTLFTDPFQVVDQDWNWLPDRIAVLVGVPRSEGSQWTVEVGVIRGADLADHFVASYAIEDDAVSDLPSVTFVP